MGVIGFGYAIRVSEAPLSRKDSYMDHSDFTSCCWEAILTMTTVGYGDFYPRTLGGRIIILFCSLYGVTIVSLIVVTLTNLLELNTQELKAFTLLEKLAAKSDIQEEATKMVGTVAKLSILKKEKG